MIAIKVNASGASQISSRVCVPLKVSPETNNACVRDRIISVDKPCSHAKSFKTCAIEYCCRQKEKVPNEQIHTHQPGRVLGSILLVPIFSSNETAMKRKGCKLYEEIT